MSIQIQVRDKTAVNLTPEKVIICGNSRYMVEFLFDDEWASEEIKTARFVYRKGGQNHYDEVAFTGNVVNVPVLSDINYVLVGVYTGNLITTTPAVVECEKSILCGSGTHKDPPPDVYNQVIAILNGESYATKDDLNDVHLRCESIEDELEGKASSSDVTALMERCETIEDELEGKASGSDVTALMERCDEIVDFAEGVREEIPTKTSQLTNDSGFIDKSVNNLENYYRKSYLDTVLGNRLQSAFRIVSTLPSSNISTKEVYVLKTATEDGTKYEEWIYGTDGWVNLSEDDLSAYALNTDLANYYLKSETYTQAEVTEMLKSVYDSIPRSVSQLTNDSGFVTKAVGDLANYYLKSETYNRTEIDSKLSAIPKFSIQVVSTLPTSGISETTVYLVKTGDESNNLYEEYIYSGGAWEKLGSQSVDLTDYAKTADVSQMIDTEFEIRLADYLTSGEIEMLLGDYYKKIDIDDKFDEVYDKGHIDNMRTELEEAIEEAAQTGGSGGSTEIYDTRKDIPEPVTVTPDGGDVPQTLTLEAGKIYTVHYGGVDYACEAYDIGDNCIILGFGYYDNPSNHEPFYLLQYEDGEATGWLLDGMGLTEGTVEFSVCEGELKKLDYKYLDYGIKEVTLGSGEVTFSTATSNGEEYGAGSTTKAALGLNFEDLEVGQNYNVYIGDSRFVMSCGMDENDASPEATRTLNEVYGVDNASVLIYKPTATVEVFFSKPGTTAGTFPVRICKEVIETIPEEFLPEGSGSGSGSGGGGTPNAVQYVEQTLTEAQQMQARANLGLYGTVSGLNEVVLEDTAFVYSSDYNGFYNEIEPTIVTGNTYLVNFNGTEYRLVASYYAVMGGWLLGNRIIMGEEDTGEPFIAIIWPGEGSTVVPINDTPSDGDEIIFGIKLYAYKKSVPKEYLPEEAVKQSLHVANGGNLSCDMTAMEILTAASNLEHVVLFYNGRMWQLQGLDMESITATFFCVEWSGDAPQFLTATVDAEGNITTRYADLTTTFISNH